MRIVVDTNSLMVSIAKISQTRWLFDAILTREVELAVSTDILEEYEEIIGRFYNSPELAKNVIETLINLPNLIRVSPFYFWYLIQTDTDDNKFVDCAVACNADYVITEDSHFDVLKTIEFPHVLVCTRAEFREILFQN